jgi:hypothetical protein
LAYLTAFEVLRSWHKEGKQVEPSRFLKLYVKVVQDTRVAILQKEYWKRESI